MNYDDAKAAADAFHAHLDGCERCERQPFNLCEEGTKLLRAAGRFGESEKKEGEGS